MRHHAAVSFRLARDLKDANIGDLPVHALSPALTDELMPGSSRVRSSSWLLVRPSRQSAIGPAQGSPTAVRMANATAFSLNHSHFSGLDRKVSWIATQDMLACLAPIAGWSPTTLPSALLCSSTTLPGWTVEPAVGNCPLRHGPTAVSRISR